MVRNFLKLPTFDEFLKNEEIKNKCFETFDATKLKWQQELDSLFEVTLYDNRAGHELIFEAYRDKLNSATTQERYDEVREHYQTIYTLTAGIIGNAKVYREYLCDTINKLENSPNQRCPCCGERISLYYIADLHDELKDVDDQLLFYETFFQSRGDEIKELQERAKKMGLETEHWYSRRHQGKNPVYTEVRKVD